MNWGGDSFFIPFSFLHTSLFCRICKKVYWTAKKYKGGILAVRIDHVALDPKKSKSFKFVPYRATLHIDKTIRIFL